MIRYANIADGRRVRAVQIRCVERRNDAHMFFDAARVDEQKWNVVPSVPE
jgi:hypothetical protein